MIPGSNINIMSSLNEGLQQRNANLGDSLQNELEFLLREQRNQSIIEREGDLNIYRSGSAPPTVEGSLSAVGTLFRHSDLRERNVSGNENGALSEDEIRSHPAYLSYYYSHENVNPRLPSPLLSKEDWRVAQRFQGSRPSFGGVGDWRRKIIDGGSSSSLFPTQPGISVHRRENSLEELRDASGRNLLRQASSEWLNRGSDGLIGLPSTGLGERRKSFADMLQEGLNRSTPLSGQLSRPSSWNAFGDIVDTTVIAEELHSRAASPGLIGVQSHGKTEPQSFSSAVGSSLSRSTTPEPQLLGRSPGFTLPPLGSRISGSGAQNGHSSGVTELRDITTNLSGLSLSKIRYGDEGSHVQSQRLDNQPNGHAHAQQQHLIDKSINEKHSFSNNYIDLSRKNGIGNPHNTSKITSMDQISFPRRTSSSTNIHRQNVNAPSIDFTDHMSGPYALNQKLDSEINNHLNAGYAMSAGGEGQNASGFRSHGASDLYTPEPTYLNFLPGASDYATHASSSLGDPSQLQNYFGLSQGDPQGLQKAYLENLLAQQKRQYELSILGKSAGYNHRYYGSPSYSLGMPYLGNHISNSGLPSVGSENPMLKNEQIQRFNSMMRSSMEGSIGSWHSDIGSNIDGRSASSLLDEFKSNKSRSFELSDIVDHVVEFSTDQYGSRFIQQKLESATEEEKTKIFPEIIPHTRSLMTDVFGNYVIQKFFEHGTDSQRKELASQLTGHVLHLSLQMYGCRVIQKALEVVDVDRQTRMVAELDGSVMKCVRDQNGNHVIQKCIECVPQDRIQFIISAFYGQVVALSTHPYGCRVIQRVLEHCDDLSTQQIIMDEIMHSVCSLSQDQYGNYVIQHVLEHSKPHERSAIISKLAGQIVKMSQQKFASNVVEKCLTFGGPEERQLLVNEMLGSTDENEPLQAMMKDPFGNYVVQQVLETCDDQSLELILSRIRVHLNSLKRYTYGKHIVSRVERLITTGERRIGLSSAHSSKGV